MEIFLFRKRRKKEHPQSGKFLIFKNSPNHRTVNLHKIADEFNKNYSLLPDSWYINNERGGKNHEYIKWNIQGYSVEKLNVFREMIVKEIHRINGGWYGGNMYVTNSDRL